MFYKYNNLEMATGTVYLVNKIFKSKGWREKLEKKSGVDLKIARSVAKTLFNLLLKTSDG